MNRMTRTAMAGALAAAVTLGAAAPAAVAKPKASHVKVDKAAKAHKKSDRSFTATERRLAKEAARKDAYLGRLARSNKVERLEDTVESAVLENIAEDRAQLGELKAQAATTDVKELKAELRGFRPEVYHTIVNQLRLSTRLQKAIAEMTDAGALSAESDGLTALVGLLSTYDAETARADLRAAQKVLSSVKEAVGAADEAGDEAGETPESETPDTDTSDSDTSDTDTTTP